MSFNPNVGVTEEMNTAAVSEGIRNPNGQRGGIHGFFERPDGLPAFQAIDDATYMHCIRKGRVPYFGANAPLDMGVHRTLTVTAGGRRVKVPNDVEILRAFVDGKTVAGTVPTPAIQAKAREWLAKLFTPSGLDVAVTFKCACGTVFGSRFALSAHQLSCVAAAPRGPERGSEGDMLLGDMALAAATGSVGPAEVLLPPSVGPGAAEPVVAKPAKPFTCRRCEPPQVFPSQSEYATHAFTHRRRDINGKYIKKGAVADAA